MRNKSTSGRLVPVALAVLFLAFAAGAIALITSLQDDRVATVDGYAVTEEEIAFHMKRLRPYVQDEFRNTLQVTLGRSDWTKEFQGRQPLVELREKALEQATRDKALFIAAYREKLIPFVGFAELKKRMQLENRNRTAAAKRGEIVYGLTRFTTESYYSHVVSVLRTELKQKLSGQEGDPLYIEGRDVEDAFQHDKANWALNATGYRVTRLTIPVPQADKEAVRKTLNGLVAQGAGLDDIQSAFSRAVEAKEVFENEDVCTMRRKWTGSMTKYSRIPSIS